MNILNIKPKEIFNQLNKYIIGQNKAKKIISIALRERWRIMKLKKKNRKEIITKNILMIGPTGVGKTEIARRISYIYKAPFIKVEATKFTEIGYVGKEVDSIIIDLLNISINSIKKEIIKKNKKIAIKKAKKEIIKILIKNKKKKYKNLLNLNIKKIKKNFKRGLFNNKKIKINIKNKSKNFKLENNYNFENTIEYLQNFINGFNITKKKKKKKIKIKEAIKILIKKEISKIINKNKIIKIAMKKVEENGIVFIDEIDKICKNNEYISSNISREGVQRDLLPLIEGCNINTKYGVIKTNNILFIASGAFYFSNPSDLMPELLGRLPIKVEFNSLSKKDYIKILTKPKNSIIKQYKKMLLTEKINIKFTKNGIKKISKITYEINEINENIGARRLYSILEKILEKISYNIDLYKNKKIKINSKYINKNFKKIKSFSNDNFIL